MAVAAVLLATVVASSLSGGDPSTDPRASFTFDVENDTVLVRHFGGDALDGSRLVVESGDHGRLGTFDGSDGMACETNRTRVRPGSVCRVPDAAYEQLYVVWEGPNNRSLILAQRAPDPTPTPRATTAPDTPTSTPTGTPTDTPVGTTGTAAPETPTPTVSPGDDEPDASTATAAPTATPTPSPTPTPTAVPTPTGTATPEPNAPVASTPTPTRGTNGTNARSSG